MFTDLEVRLMLSFWFASVVASWGYQYQCLFYIVIVCLGGFSFEAWLGLSFLCVVVLLISGVIRAAKAA